MPTQYLTGALPGTCDICFKPTGNLPKHRVACARKRGRLPLGVPVTEDEEALIVRAGTHAMNPALLEPQARFYSPVSDLHVARLVHHVESGVKVWPSPTRKTWYADESYTGKQHSPSITRIVMEALRTEVVAVVTEKTGVNRYGTFLRAEPTHARSAEDAAKPACKQFGRGNKRWRLLDIANLMYVDCLACLDRPTSSVAL